MQLAQKTMQPVLLQLSVWCVGEYGETLIGTVPAGIDTADYTVPDPSVSTSFRAPLFACIGACRAINA